MNDIYRVAVNAWMGEGEGTAHDAGLRAVEAAVRAEQAIECNNARFDLLRDLAAAQAVIAEAQAFKDDSAMSDANTLEELDRILAQSPTDALQAVKAAAWDEGYGDDKDCHVPRINPYRATPSTPELPEGENRG